jgi:hypothetical protein
MTEGAGPARSWSGSPIMRITDDGLQFDLPMPQFDRAERCCRHQWRLHPTRIHYRSVEAVWEPKSADQVRPEPNAASSMALVGRGWLRRLIPCCNGVCASFLPLGLRPIPREARKPSGRHPPLSFRPCGCSGGKPLPSTSHRGRDGRGFEQLEGIYHG